MSIFSEFKESLSRRLAPWTWRGIYQWLIVCVPLLYGSVDGGQTVAVLPFKGADTTSESVSRGLRVAEHISSFIGKSGMVQLVERIQLEKMAGEIALHQSGMINEEDIIDAGKVAGADYIVIGSHDIVQKNIKVNARIVEVKSGLVKGSAIEEGLKESDVLDRISIQLLSILGVKTTPNSSYKIRRALGWSGVAVGLAAAGTAVWNHFTYVSADKDYRTRYDLSAGEYKDLRSKAQFHMNSRYYTGGASVALAATGIILLAVNRSQWVFTQEETQKAEKTLDFDINPGSVMLIYNF